MHRVLVVKAIHPDALRLFDERADVEYEVVDDSAPEVLVPRIAGVDAITLRADPLAVQVIEAAAELRVVSRHGVGVDNVPVEACTERGIPVTIVGDVNTVSVAEHTLFLLLAAARAGAALDGAVRSGHFADRDRSTAVELAGRTLLVVGFGRIGREVAHRAAAFGMRIVVHDPWFDGVLPAGVERVDLLDDGLAVADALTLHVPLTPRTRHMIDAGSLDRLRPGAIVVNAARGGLLDETALVERIRSGRLHGAGLDVFETEPLPDTSPLAAERRIVLSPHSAALSDRALLAMGTMTVRNVLDAFDGRLDPRLVVNPSVLTAG